MILIWPSHSASLLRSLGRRRLLRVRGSTELIGEWIMTARRIRTRNFLVERIDGVLLVLLVGCLIGTAQAAGSNMPWEAPLQSILESIQGPVARIVAVIIIIATGLTLAFGDTSGGFRKLVQIVFGLSIAFAASSFFLSFFSFSGGAVLA